MKVKRNSKLSLRKFLNKIRHSRGTRSKMWKIEKPSSKISFEELLASYVSDRPPASFTWYSEVTTEEVQLPACLQEMSQEEQKVLTLYNSKILESGMWCNTGKKPFVRTRGGRGRGAHHGSRDSIGGREDYTHRREGSFHRENSFSDEIRRSASEEEKHEEIAWNIPSSSSVGTFDDKGVFRLPSGEKKIDPILETIIPSNSFIPTHIPVRGATPVQWLYRDPSGNIQGPFGNREMFEWFQAGYFPPSLLLKRLGDPAFEPLGLLLQREGIPFVERDNLEGLNLMEKQPSSTRIDSIIERSSIKEPVIENKASLESTLSSMSLNSSSRSWANATSQQSSNFSRSSQNVTSIPYQPKPGMSTFENQLVLDTFDMYSDSDNDMDATKITQVIFKEEEKEEVFAQSAPKEFQQFSWNKPEVKTKSLSEIQMEEELQRNSSAPLTKSASNGPKSLADIISSQAAPTSKPPVPSVDPPKTNIVLPQKQSTPKVSKAPQSVISQPMY